MARRRQTDRQFSGRRRVLDEAEVVRVYLGSGSRLKQTAREFSTSAAKVREVLVRHGIDVSGLRPLDAAKVLARYEEIRSVKQVAADLHVAPARVTEILDAAGVHRKRLSTAPPPDDDRLRQLHANGHTLEEIAEHVDWSSESVRRRLSALGLGTGRRRPVLPVDKIVDAYRREHLSVQRIATRHQITSSAVYRVLADHDVTIRTRGEANTRIDQAELRRLFEEGATTEEMARRLGATRSGIGSALERAGLHRQRPDASDRIDEIAELHAQGLGDAEIAERLGVATWNVSRLRRQHGIGRTWWDYPPPDRNELVQRVGQCVTIVELATHYRVPSSTVRRWLAHHDIEAPAHPLRGRRQERQPGRLHHDLLERDYVEAELPASAVGDRVGVSKRSVLSALHREALPVRASGNSGRDSETVLLQRLLADHQIQAVCRRRHIPLPPNGRIELTASLLRDLYDEVGLSQLAVSLITGQSEQAVRHAMQRVGIAPRSGQRSPWRQATATGPRARD